MGELQRPTFARARHSIPPLAGHSMKMNAGDRWQALQIFQPENQRAFHHAMDHQPIICTGSISGTPP
jgi:hypothetical protein